MFLSTDVFNNKQNKCESLHHQTFHFYYYKYYKTAILILCFRLDGFVVYNVYIYIHGARTVSFKKGKTVNRLLVDLHP